MCLIRKYLTFINFWKTFSQNLCAALQFPLFAVKCLCSHFAFALLTYWQCLKTHTVYKHWCYLQHSVWKCKMQILNLQVENLVYLFTNKFCSSSDKRMFHVHSKVTSSPHTSVSAIWMIWVSVFLALEPNVDWSDLYDTFTVVCI